MEIIDYIPEGKENAVSRAELARLTGWKDRDIREAIKKANRAACAEGFAILSSSGAKGYWKTSDPVEIEDYCRESRNRQRSLFLNDSPIYDLLRRITGTKTVKVREHLRRLPREDQIEGQTSLEVEECRTGS